MLFTITYTGENAPDLGYLLHKNPSRPQRFELNFGSAYVFYPELSQSRCTAALLLDIDPLDLARGKPGSKEGGLFDYVNDRPYVSSSFMSVAISRVFGTALSGHCEKRQELADAALDLSASLAMLPCRGDTALLADIFEPLGYTVDFTVQEFDEKFPVWGQSPYVDVRLQGRQRLRDLLRHLYVLIPVFDRRKHYYISANEVDKLLSHGAGWLEQHPKKEMITRRYFSKLQSLTRIALDRLDNGEGAAGESSGNMAANALPATEPPEIPDGNSGIDGLAGLPLSSLNARRLEAVVKALKEQGAASVIDVGCGEGNLLRLLLREKTFTKIAAADVSLAALERAKEKLKIDRLPESQKKRITFFQSSVTYRDPRFAGYDAAAVIEVIEHLDESRLDAFEAALFGEAKPKTVIISTPNREYNKNYPGLNANNFRHGDHRFEWTREQFHAWAEKTAARFGYHVSYENIGDMDELAGTPTQMGVFTKCE